MATSVAIEYGIITGKKVGKKFRRALIAAGYTCTDNLNQADIIIGHSAGCFLLSETRPEQQLILINPPYWPGKTIKQRANDRSKSFLHFKQNGLTFGYWLTRTWWGIYYAATDRSRTRRLARLADDFNLEDFVIGRKLSMIRNDNDDWLTPDLDEITARNPDVKIIHIPGDHDDCWLHPEPYITAIRNLA